MYCALKSIYCNVQCSVRLNGVLSDWFAVRMGLNQGCLLSPLLFNIYMNDLSEEIKAMNSGVNIDDVIIAILMFADDIALIVENEGDLQKMMDKLNSWEKWKIVRNEKKTQVMHFRPSCIKCRKHIFTCGRAEIQVVDKYRYLGLVFNEFMDMSQMAEVVVQAASRALGVLISKYKSHGSLPFAVYSRLYYALVQPILDYGAAVWGTREFRFINDIQHRACKVFLEVGKSTPTATILADMG